jgi:hypothetical protein
MNTLEILIEVSPILLLVITLYLVAYYISHKPLRRYDLSNPKDFKDFMNLPSRKESKTVKPSKSVDRNFEELSRLGWFDYTPASVRVEAEAILRDRLASEYVDTSIALEEHPLKEEIMASRMDANYWISSMDCRVFDTDPEDLAERETAGFITRVDGIRTFYRNPSLINETMRKQQVVDGNTVIIFDEVEYLVHAGGDTVRFNWAEAVNAVIRILDSLLEKSGSKDRAYCSWSGNNDARFEYLTKARLDGGLGPVKKEYQTS